MKKILSIILSALLLFVIIVPAFAESADRLTTEYSRESGIVTVSYSARLSVAEDALKQVRELMLKRYSFQELEQIPSLSFATKDVILFLSLSDGENIACLPLTGAEGTAEFSLYEDILPLFPDDTDFSQGADLSAEIIPATVGYPDKNAMSFPSVAVKGDGEINVPETGRINYNLPENSVNDNPRFFSLPLTKAITLTYPTLTGCIFSGWTQNGKAVAKIAAGTVNTKLTAEFTPRTYNINYVLTTDITFSFGRADNTKNPVTYTYGETVRLNDLKSPVGGYTFYGWYLENGEPITEIKAGTTGDILIYAKWVSDEDLVRIAYLDDLRELLDNHFADLDTDGEITVSDARLTLRMAISLDEYSKEYIRRGDTTGTGNVRVADARTILRIAIGLDNVVEIYRNARSYYES